MRLAWRLTLLTSLGISRLFIHIRRVLMYKNTSISFVTESCLAFDSKNPRMPAPVRNKIVGNPDLSKYTILRLPLCPYG